MRDDADFGFAERRVGLDAVDERGAARRRGEQPLERDHRRPPSVIASRASSASVSVNVSSSIAGRRRALRAPADRSGEAMRTVQDRRATTEEYTAARDGPPPYRDVTVGDLLTQLSAALPGHDALVYYRRARVTHLRRSKRRRARLRAA